MTDLSHLKDQAARDAAPTVAPVEGCYARLRSNVLIGPLTWSERDLCFKLSGITETSAYWIVDGRCAWIAAKRFVMRTFQNNDPPRPVHRPNRTIEARISCLPKRNMDQWQRRYVTARPVPTEPWFR
jgi:hypothetical protein